MYDAERKDTVGRVSNMIDIFKGFENLGEICADETCSLIIKRKQIVY